MRTYDNTEPCPTCGGAVDKTVMQLRAALLTYRYEDCPECHAHAEMVADVEPLTPGSQSYSVTPTGWTITHLETCSIGKLMASLGNHSAVPNSSSEAPCVGQEGS